jgi:parallel beta-helix repeat protein
MVKRLDQGSGVVMNHLAVVCLGLAAGAGVLARDIHVTPRGSDANPGTRESPVASVHQALALARGTDPVTVWLADGEYGVGDGLVLAAADGQLPALTLRAESPRQARLTGARQVTGFQPIAPDDAQRLISPAARTQVLVADLKALGFPALAALPDAFRAPGCEEVFFAGQPLQSARWPNEGFATFTEVIDPGASDPIHWVTREVYRPGSFRFPSDRAKHWDFSRGVYLHAFWCYEWADEVLKAASYSPETGELRLAAKHGYGIGNPREKPQRRPFYALHVFEELDAPGEYYLDRQANRLYLWPPGDLATTPVWLSLCRQPLLKATAVSGLVLRDLIIEHGCGWGVHLGNCTQSRVENCLVRNLGQGGIAIAGGRDNQILRCEVTGTGAQAIAMTAGERKTLTRGNCAALGNHLHHLGRLDWMNGRGVVLGGCGNRVANNLIHHCPTGGVSYGGNEHLLELNEVHSTCLLYADVGVFYTGRDWASRGNVVRWNYIHGTADHGGSGSQAIYLDDCDSGDEVIGNIVFGGVGRGVLLGGGRDNTIRGNVFIDLPRGIHVDARGPRGITLDKPGSWNLKAKCEELEYLSPLWRERYPKLARVLDEEPLLPMGNVMRNNVFVGCKSPFALAKDVTPEWLTRENNPEFPLAEFPFLPAAAAGATLDLTVLPRVWERVPGFEPIPVERIGPKGL